MGRDSPQPTNHSTYCSNRNEKGDAQVLITAQRDHRSEFCGLVLFWLLLLVCTRFRHTGNYCAYISFCMTWWECEKENNWRNTIVQRYIHGHNSWAVNCKAIQSYNGGFLHTCRWATICCHLQEVTCAVLSLQREIPSSGRSRSLYHSVLISCAEDLWIV